MGFIFHKRTGSMVTLTNNDKTAYRNNPHQEFNNGLVLSSEPLQDEELFEVRIDKKVPTWSGSIEIGVTNMNPTFLDFPSSATNLRDGSWVMSGNSILEDGKSIIEDYGHDLDDLSEGDTVGVMRNRNGDLHFYINGIDHGLAAKNVTGFIYAVVDMYGKCAQVTIIEREYLTYGFMHPPDKLRFHEHCGTMVMLSNDNRTAERRKPCDEFNNGVVMTYRPLMDNELFEIRIDELVNKWSGSIEMGVTTHNPDTLEFPATMTNLKSGTIMMSGSGILTNGKGSRREYGQYNLDELQEGDRIALVKKSNKKLYYYINGYDQGVAAEIVPDIVFGVVDLYGMTVKVSITDNIRPIVYPVVEVSPSGQTSQKFGIRYDDLAFSEKCGRHVVVLNEGRTACRPRCLDDFNDAVVITNRTLKPGEIFEVLLEQIVMKWAGTIEIGITTHSADEIDFPSTMTNVRSGTWMMTGNGIMYNGTTMSDDYGYNLDKLKAGDRIGLVVYGDGTLHFFVNGIDQGLAATNIPRGVYGVIDLYGQAAKASIVSYADSDIFFEDISADLPASRNYFEDLQMSQSSISDDRKNSIQGGKSETDYINEVAKPQVTPYDPHSIYFDDEEDSWDECTNDVELPFSFHSVCGANIDLFHLRTIAYRKKGYNNGLIFSSSCIKRNEMYEIQLGTCRSNLAGFLRFGVTTYEPDKQAALPTDVFNLNKCDTWVISDSHLYKNGVEINRNYVLPFHFLKPPDTLGLKVLHDDSLHFYLNGTHMGVGAVNMPKALRIVVDVYGKCFSVIIPNEGTLSSSDFKNIEKKSEMSTPLTSTAFTTMAFHENHGRNIQLTNDNLTACRIASYNQGVLLSSKTLEIEELFQVQIENIQLDWSGSLQIGVTAQNPDQICLPTSALAMKRNTWIISENSVFYNGTQIKSKFNTNLNNIKNGHKIGVQVDTSNNLHLYVNNKDLGIAAEGISLPVYVVIDVYGKCKQVTISTEPYIPEDESDKDDKEKANVEYDGEKIEKPVISNQTPKVCEMQRICAILKTCLGFPDQYFLSNGLVCYCEICHGERGEELYFEKGDPPKYCAQPLGWCSFPLIFSTKTEKTNIDKWHLAYHGVGFGAVYKVLEQGSLLPPVFSGFKVQKVQTKVSTQKEQSKEFDNDHVLLSPTMLYMVSSKFTPKFEFSDSETEKKYFAKVAFQVLIRPGSYVVGPQQLGVSEQIDEHFNNNDLEWYTKEEGSIVLQSLLMKIEPV